MRAKIRIVSASFQAFSAFLFPGYYARVVVKILGAVHNPGENALARQPGIFRNGNRQLGGGTAPLIALSGTPLLVSENARVLLLACPVTQHRFPLSRAHGLLRRLRTILTA